MLKNEYVLTGHSASKQSKILKLESANDNRGVYNLITKWDNCPSLDNYCQICYNDTPNGKMLISIDFDGGPKLTIGDWIDIKNNVKIINFLYDENFSNIKVVLEQKCNF